MAEQSARYARANERRRKDKRNAQIVEMWKGGMTVRQIEAAMAAAGEPLSKTRVQQIITAALAEARKLRESMVTELYDGELERLTAIIRHAWGIVTATCRACGGRGMVEAIASVGATEVACMNCGGSSYLHRADTRIRAMKEARGAIGERAKLLGLYAPERVLAVGADGTALDLRLREAVEGMPPDELERSLADFAAGVEAARRLDAHAK